MTYAEAYHRSLTDPSAFWLDAAGAIEWAVPPTRAVDANEPPQAAWFPGGELNTCHNALDRHVDAGRGDRAALIYDSAMLGTQQTYTYRELLDEVRRFAGGLRSQGVGAGDRVVIYLPMIPEALIAMLATARLGAVHSVVFGGFAARELALRITDAEPTVVVTASGGLEPNRHVEYLPTVVEALAQSSHPVSAVIVRQRAGFTTSIEDCRADDAGGGLAGAGLSGAGLSGAGQRCWVGWDEAVADVAPAEAVPVAATDPLYILYTSGTTGTPKGVVRDNGGHAVAMAWSMTNIYDIGPSDVLWTASDVGWVVGHSYIVYAPLLVGATTVLYEGKPVGTPDASAFWRVIADHGVNVLFTAPTALRAIRKADPRAELLAGHDVSSLRTLFAAGERLDIDTYEWISETLRVPVIDHWWQTETGWAVCANPMGIEHLPIKPGSPTLPMPGYRLEILDGLGSPSPAGQEGNIALRHPLPPGTLTTLWRNDARYVSSYWAAFDGYYATGDSGYVDPDGYVFVMGRTDDIINVAGHRLSTGAMEQVIGTHPAVAECAVIGIADRLKGQRPSAYVVLKSGVTLVEDELAAELVTMVRRQIGPVADFKTARVVEALPKTRSGKILRKTMRQMADGVEHTVPSTIEDPSVLESLAGVLSPKA